MTSSFSLRFCINTHLYPTCLTSLGVWTIGPNTLCLAKEVNYASIASFHLSQSCLNGLRTMIIYNVSNYYKRKHIINDNFFISSQFKGLSHILGICLFKRSFKVFGLINDQSSFQNITLRRNLTIFGFKCLFKALLLMKSLYIVKVFGLFIDYLLF